MFSGISSYIWGSGDCQNAERGGGEKGGSVGGERGVEVEERPVAAESGNGDEWILIDVQEKSGSNSRSGSSSRKQRKCQMKKGTRNKVIPDTPILVPNLRFISSSEKRQKKLKSNRKALIPKSMTQDEEVEAGIPSLATLPVSSSDAPMSTTASSSSSSDTDDRPSYAAMAKVVASSSVKEEAKEGSGSKVEQLKPLPLIVVKSDPERRTKGKKSSKDKGSGLMEGSWFVTPPPCFTKPNTFSLAASPDEDSLIEHPSIVTSITAPSFSHDDHGAEMSSNASTPLVSSPQDSPMVVSATSSLNNSPPPSPMIINRSPGVRESKDRKAEDLEPSGRKAEVRMSEDGKLKDRKAEVGPETVAEKESVCEADIRALARRTLDLRSSDRSGNRFAKLEAEDHFYPGFFSLPPPSAGQVKPIKSSQLFDGKPLTMSYAESMSETTQVYGPENRPDDYDDYDEEDGQSIDTTESLDSDHDDLDSLVHDHSRPILADNLSALNIVSRMERKGRSKRKGAKGRKGKQQQEGKENSAEDGEGDVGKRNSSSERAHAGACLLFSIFSYPFSLSLIFFSLTFSFILE